MKRNSAAKSVAKAPTGISGLDEITQGGFPRGRSALVAGGAGSGKTLLGLEFVLNGALDYGEPGVVITFEEGADELATNMASLGYDVAALIKAGRVVIDHIDLERREIYETGEYDLDGLFIRIEHAIQKIKAKRVLLDTAEVLFAGLQNEAIVRAELARLFRWLKSKNVTAVVTAEVGQGVLTRHGLEEYVADCVIHLDHRITEQISTRRIRVVKYRGSVHGTNEYPFLIDDHGLSVLPITSVGLTHQASTETVSSGIAGIDEMLDGRGFYRGSSILVAGSAGTGKSIVAAHFANAACARGESCIYFAFEESPSQILRNMRSVGLNLEQWIKKGLLRIIAVRPTSTGLENHLLSMHQEVMRSDPRTVVVDPITNLISVADAPAVKSMLTRLIDFLKMRQITALFTNLSAGDQYSETSTEISSLMDVWILVRDLEVGTTRRRVLYILKSRGMAHSNHIREFLISDNGVELLGPAQMGPRAVTSERQGNGRKKVRQGGQ